MNKYQQATLAFLVVLFVTLANGHVYKKYQVIEFCFTSLQ